MFVKNDLGFYFRFCFFWRSKLIFVFECFELVKRSVKVEICFVFWNIWFAFFLEHTKRLGNNKDDKKWRNIPQFLVVCVYVLLLSVSGNKTKHRVKINTLKTTLTFFVYLYNVHAVQAKHVFLPVEKKVTYKLQLEHTFFLNNVFFITVWKSLTFKKALWQLFATKLTTMTYEGKLVGLCGLTWSNVSKSTEELSQKINLQTGLQLKSWSGSL